MKKIFFIDSRNPESRDFHKDRQNFYEKLINTYKITVVEKITPDIIPDIIFIHQGFKMNSNLMSSESKRNPLLENSIFIFYGNNPQEALKISEKEISYYNFYTLEENFDEFYDELSKSGLINSVWDTLLGYDPQLEKLLEPFQNLSPFEVNLPIAKDESGSSKKDNKGKEITIKQDLNNYINKKLSLSNL